MAFSKALTAALVLLAFLALRTSAQTVLVQDGQGVILNDDGSISVVSGGETVYTSPAGVVDELEALKALSPVPAPAITIPDVPIAAPKADEVTGTLKSILGEIGTGRKLLRK